jgi:hypothetical protein
MLGFRGVIPPFSVMSVPRKGAKVVFHSAKVTGERKSGKKKNDPEEKNMIKLTVYWDSFDACTYESPEKETTQ